MMRMSTGIAQPGISMVWKTDIYNDPAFHYAQFWDGRAGG
jgi:hypothetical protein